MERANRLHFLVTQNVDRLHIRAGSKRVLELHGENSMVHCIACGYREPRTQTQARLEWENRHVRLPIDEAGDAEEVQVPLCPQCDGLVKPAVVFFGEPIPVTATQRSLEMVSEGDALLVVGSSLTVWSGYRLVRQARSEGKPVYILNIGPTRANADATLKVEAPAGEALHTIASYMGIELKSAKIKKSNSPSGRLESCSFYVPFKRNRKGRRGVRPFLLRGAREDY